jgi:hypothetical protein
MSFNLWSLYALMLKSRLFDDEFECMIEGNRTALSDWLADPSAIPKIIRSIPGVSGE